jgi:hypothetical protein
VVVEFFDGEVLAVDMDAEVAVVVIDVGDDALVEAFSAYIEA